MITKNKRLTGIVLIVALLLLIPFIAMQFTDEVKWSPLDFTIAGILLLGTGLLCELAMRTIPKTGYRLVACGILVAVLILIWIELAVGIFGTRFAGS